MSVRICSSSRTHHNRQLRRVGNMPAKALALPNVLGCVAALLLLAAVVYREPSVHSLGLQAVELDMVQTGNGLAVLPIHSTEWEVSSGPRDERLADQVARWTRGRSTRKAGEVLIAEKGTQQLAQVRSGATELDRIKHKMRQASQQLRLSNFLTGVDAKETQKEVEKLYKSIDPTDETLWQERDQVGKHVKVLSKRQQLKQIEKFKTILEGEMSTTSRQDSAKVSKMRDDLKTLLSKRDKLEKSINDEEDQYLKAGGDHRDLRKVKPDPAETEDIINRLARKEDAHASFKSWINGQQRHSTAVGGKLQSLSQKGGKKGSGKNEDLIKAAAERYDFNSRRRDRENIEQKAAYKVSRWMGGGYVKVYDMAQG